MEPISDASPSEARARPLPSVLQIEMIELLHGTSSRNWKAIQESGQLGRPCQARAQAEEVAEAFGLDSDALYESSSYEFARSREGDPRLYLTSDLRVAARHAEICSEILEDALLAAFRMLHPRTNYIKSPGKERLEAFRARYRAEHGLEPVVLRVRLPIKKVPVPEGSKVQDPSEWWHLANSLGSSHTLMLPEPLPASAATELVGAVA